MNQNMNSAKSPKSRGSSEVSRVTGKSLWESVKSLRNSWKLHSQNWERSAPRIP